VICRTRQDELETLTTRARWWLWSLIALFVITAVGLRMWQIRKRDADQQAWMTRCTQIDTLSKTAHQLVQTLWNSNGANGRMKRTALEQAVNGGKPFAQSINYDSGVTVKWVDPASGRPFEFNFIDNYWIGWGSQGGSMLYPPPPGAMLIENDLEHLRGAIAGWNSGYGPLFWIILLIMFLSLRRWRPVMAQWMLALAIVCSVAWLVHPGFTFTRHGIFSNDMLLWGVIMMTVSGAAMYWSREKRIKPILPVCPKCRYNLTGNVSGVCPECGKPIPIELARRFQLGAASPATNSPNPASC